MKRKVIPLILAGGKGSRFWPLSRENCPKQFLRFDGEETLLEKTLCRGKTIAENAVPYILAGADQYDLTVASLKEQEGRDYHFLGEPCRKNTAAAIWYGCRSIMEREGDAVFVILPADHAVTPPERFAADIAAGVALAEETDAFVLFGAKPRYAATGFGYAEVGHRRCYRGHRCYRVRRFTEKPDKKRAKAYLEKGGYYWNTGIFVFTAAAFDRSYEKHLPQIAALAELLADGAEEAVAEAYGALEEISFDKGILEQEEHILLKKASFLWDDVGSYPGLSGLLPADERGNLCRGRVLAKDTANSVILTDNPLTVVLGVKNLIVAEDHGVLLVCPRERAEDIAGIPSLLKEGNEVYR